MSGKGTSPSGEWGDWLAPREAWARVRAAWGPPLCEDEQVDLAACRGRVLAEDVSAPRDSPAFDRSAVDGYALRSAETTTASADTPAALIYAGDVPMGAASALAVGPGRAVWVATGSMIPDGADGVVMVERTARDGETVRVMQQVRPGDGIVRRGDDLQAGARVLRTGSLLRPQDVAVLASMGLARVPVRRRPRVAIVSGGDELVTPGEPLQPGQIYDSNSFAMAAQIAAWGGDPVVLPRVQDQPEQVRARLEQAVREADIVLLSGGSSVGVKDLTAEAIDALGPPGVIVHGVAMRPARPTIIGVVEGRLVIGIPGNPVSAMVACEVFARPALETLLGLPVREAGAVGEHVEHGRLAEDVRSQPGRQDYVRVRLERTGDEVLVRPVSGGSNAIRSLVDADGYLVVPPERAGLGRDELVEVSLFD
jgi:molybdopterin molybdotransferase